MKQKGKAFKRALKTKDAVRLEADLPLITDTTELITVERAQQLIKRNKCNRPIVWSQVEKFAEDMRQGKWVFHGQGIMLDNSGNILTGQKRLMAVIISQTPQYFRISRGSPPETADYIDRGAPQTARDLATRKTERKHSPTEQSFARAILALRGNIKPKPDDISAVIVEFDDRFATAMQKTRGIRKTKEINMVIAAICVRESYDEEQFATVQLLSKRFVKRLQPIEVVQCWNRGAAFTMAMEKAVDVVKGK